MEAPISSKTNLERTVGAVPAYTLQLAEYLAGLRVADIPKHILHEGKRGVLDWIGCAYAGSRHQTIGHLLSVLEETGGQGRATVIAHGMKLGLLEAPLANGQMGHVLDYDDTHLADTTVLHTSSPVLSALFALAERSPVSGGQMLLAYAVGFEAGIRVGRTAPNHLESGWHLTGTLGSIAAAAASAKLLALDGKQIDHAMAIGATQAAGMQQNRGTMCKSFHAGKAGMNGLLAGLLAQKGFNSSLDFVEGKLGFCRIYSDTSVPEALVADLGNRWEIARNGHKPYACGIVQHPAIDAALAIRAKASPHPEDITEIGLRVHRHAISVTGTKEPDTGLHSKFSVFHSVAVALIDGTAGIAQYTDERANDKRVMSLRRKVTATADETFRKDQASAWVIANGVRHEAVIDHASGTAENPVSDTALEAKFMANVEPITGATRAREIADMVWRLDELADASELVRLCG
jgi:2-methylcitrate dehydratase PrpD